MKIDDLLKSPSEWVKAEGPNSKIVMSSRVRLARNIRDHPFPGWAKKVERQKLLDVIQPVVEALPEMAEHFGDSMDNISAIHKQVLVERHLISREHAAKNVGSGVVINDRETISVMVNEEDHLRMQAIKSGLQLKSIFKIIDRVDTELEEHLEFAFSPKLGYLTACPTNVGTGMRGSAMLHLPGMVLSDQINQVVQAVNKLGLAVRGLYGEGTEALGNVFQVSNQTTLGEKEMEVVERLNKVILQIIEHEENARITLLEKKPKLVYDQIGRAYGILTNAHTISSKEALNLLSLVRMGVDLEIFPATARVTVDEMFILSQPAHVQRVAARKLTAEERDILRAELIRAQLATISKPDLSHRPRGDGGQAEPE
jgi:protein arginine kinase